MFGLHLLWMLVVIRCSKADIYVFKEFANKSIMVVPDLPAIFGPGLPEEGLQGVAVASFPVDGCTKVIDPPKDVMGPFILVVHRYKCSFVEKVLNAQAAGYSSVIVRNVGSNSLEVMNGDKDAEKVEIPSVFIGEDDGLMIEKYFVNGSGYRLLLDDNLPFDLKDYLLPFAVTIGVCFLLLLSFMIIKCIRDYKQSRRHRLSSRALKKLPIHKFKKGDPYECCAVCLDDYVDNDKLRVLPCQHAYHAKCIDPWLTKNRRVCPVCKRKVIAGDERPSDVESESEDEYAPLVNSNAGTQGGTFNNQRENPFTVAGRQQNSRYARLGEEETSEDSTDDDEEALLGAAAPISTEVVEVSASMEDEVSSGSHIVEIRDPQDNKNPSQPPPTIDDDCLV